MRVRVYLLLAVAVFEIAAGALSAGPTVRPDPPLSSTPSARSSEDDELSAALDAQAVETERERERLVRRTERLLVEFERAVAEWVQARSARRKKAEPQHGSP